MAAANVNRETVRDALQAGLEGVLVGAGLSCQAVYGYRIGDPAGLSPLALVLSAGSERPKLTQKGSWGTFFFDVEAWVLYTDGAGWNEDAAEDRLDLIEKTVADYVDDNRTAANWQALYYAGRSDVREVMSVGGNPYLVETIHLAVTVI